MLKKKFFAVVVVLLICNSFSKAQTPVYEPDSLVLVEFNRQMMEAGWPSLWDMSKPLREWKGVYPDYWNKGKVAWINLGDYNLPEGFMPGSLPAGPLSVLLHLDSLRDLSFHHMGLTSVPKEIEIFTDITHLSFSYNELQTLPPEINNLTNLEYLSIGYNKLVDLPDMSGLAKLTYLWIPNNYTLTEIPASVMNIPNLKNLSVGWSNLAALPDNIGDLAQLEILDCDAMKLTALPESLSNLTNLKELYLNNNQISALPAFIGDLTNLENMDVGGNLLTELPSSFSNLMKLKRVVFSRNNFTAFPQQLAGLPELKYIYGERNQMEGSVPAEIFDIRGVQLYLNDNSLSGHLAIKKFNPPERLMIKNNRFTFKDYMTFYHRMVSANVQVHPQQNIGSIQTIIPKAGEEVTIAIPDYEPAQGATFEWFRSDVIDKSGVSVGNTETLTYGDFNPSTQGGNYYCEVKHPSLPGFFLRSHFIRVIGEDEPPTISNARDIRFRPDVVYDYLFTVTDDYTSVNDLVIDIPIETPHFRIRPDSIANRQTRRYVYPKDKSWSGTDTLTITVTDEFGNVTTKDIKITLLPSENQPPVIALDSVYLSIFDGTQFPCTPGTAGCEAFYPFISGTFFKHFITDDFTDVEDLEFSILEAGESGVVSDDVYAFVSLQTEGYGLDVIVMARQDTIVELTLEVLDDEGGKSTKKIRFIGKTDPFNANPEIAPIPDQSITKGTDHFPEINLSDYASDDYVAPELWLWQASGPGLTATIEEGVLHVKPVFPDSAYSAELTVALTEKTNFYRWTSIPVNYHVTNAITIGGKVTDAEGQAMEGISIAGFDDPILTAADGSYEVEVADGWSGWLSASSAGYTFIPDTIWFESVESSMVDQDFTGSLKPAESFTISGKVIDNNGQAMEGISIAGFDDPILTAADGSYQVEVADGWSGWLSASSAGYTFTPDTIWFESVESSIVDQDFTGSLKPAEIFTISGKVTDNNGQAMEGISIGGFDDAILTSADGSYQVEVLDGWSGWLSASSEGYTFTPDTIWFESVDASAVDQDFVAHYIGNYIIAGSVLSEEGEPVSQVLLKGFSEEVLTDEEGNYTTQVPYDWEGTVVPEREGFTFDPESVAYTSIGEDLLAENFTAVRVVTAINREQTVEFSIYPNPAHARVIFSVSSEVHVNGSIDIINATGKHIHTIMLQDQGEMYEWESEVVLSPGIYVAKLQLSDNKSQTAKFIVR